MKSPGHIIRRALEIARGVDATRREIENLKFNQGRIWSRLDESNHSPDLGTHEFQVFSQWGEDGIIQHLSRRIPITHKTFIEFGVEDFHESNCRFLMMKDGWRGMVMDGSSDNIARIETADFHWRHDLRAIFAFITRDNINELLRRSDFPEDLGILSVDLDGNDYHVLRAIEGFQPRILICEYNAVFGAERAISVPYDPAFQRTKAHYSNLYWGASLAALTLEAERRGLSLVGTNSAGNNAFFVRRDLLGPGLLARTPLEAFTPALYRESRDQNGNLSYMRSPDRLKILQGLPVINVSTGSNETL
jgi:hypothetical protein